MACFLSVGTGVSDDLGCQVLGCAAECVGLSILYFLGESKVDQLKVTFGVYEYVFGLQVAVCDAFPFVEEL
jgi:hypothetical protein